MRKAILTLLFAVSHSSALAGPAPFELKGLRLGMTKEQTHAVFPSARCSIRDDSLVCYVPDVPFGEVKTASLMYTFQDEIVMSVYVSLEERAFSSVAEGLKSKFGVPTSETSGPVQNRMGATFDNTRLTWTDGDSSLEARQRAGSINKSSVTLSSQSAIDKWTQKKKDRAAAAAKNM